VRQSIGQAIAATMRRQELGERRPTAERDMSLLALEGAAAVCALLIALEMRRQRRPWQSILVSALVVFMTLTVMILMWRGA
jgi:hypothetical protein